MNTTQNFIDRYSSTLSSGYTSGATSLSVASASGLPSGSCYFFLIVKAESSNSEEVFLVTNVSGTTLTVVGAQASTSASNHSSGAAVIGSILTSAGLTQMTKSDLLSGEKIKRGGTNGYAKGKAVALASGATTTLVNYTGSGYLASFWVAVGSLPSGHSQDLKVKVTIDGSVMYNDTLAAFLGCIYWTDSVNTNFSNQWLMNGGAQSVLSRIPIPFGTSLKIEVTNNYTGSITLWYEVAYVYGVANTGWLRAKQLKIAVNSESTGGLALTQNQVGTLLDVSGLQPGRLLGVYLMMDGYAVTAGTQQSFLEGALRIYTDGTLAYESSGLEDYFGMSGYFANVTVPYGNQDVTLNMKRTGSAAYLYGAMRFHSLDPILFENALKITVQAGDSAGSGLSFTGTLHLMFTVWYYTE